MKRTVLEFKGEQIQITQKAIEQARQYMINKALVMFNDTEARAKYIKDTTASLNDDNLSFDYRCLKFQLGAKMDMQFHEYRKTVWENDK
ncbi:hypothetical protein Acj9p035 [Acinetobacter phage Acj9]|uniref:Uncharacterized protein n=1 Tax=Acinetobacter phage Acj9 TaxID=760939 RepID=E5EPG9_9CAUD|nr:hypothetical protein Acj9p035 [Acinetobacter phage Acj9]ADG59935.1 hypothetical protein Acj9p035 [Acinetobacter phage Acj9]